MVDQQHNAENQHKHGDGTQNQQNDLEHLHVKMRAQGVGGTVNDGGRGVAVGRGGGGGGIALGGQHGLGGVRLAQNVQRLGQRLTAHGHQALAVVACHLFAVDGGGQVLGQKVGRAAHGGFPRGVQLPAVQLPHAV